MVSSLLEKRISFILTQTVHVTLYLTDVSVAVNSRLRIINIQSTSCLSWNYGYDVIMFDLVNNKRITCYSNTVSRRISLFKP